MKKLRKLLFLILLGGCCYVHRNVITAAVKGEPVPPAPKWHFWCKNRRSY